ncbi:tetratricopeptide repeat protein [Treponema parvum]|uniref:Tetratricopeptide repeat protein n=1 Tax=Treponema parvum TaxID=138851 RepID=A0A975IC32_9SPIR|nr:tetratricopeptide repeat protein [Treponema parvum]QTQ11337.1 tetratricopeptide repeat protein [Treponema parvum]
MAQEKIEKKTFSEVLGNFILKNRKIILCVFAVSAAVILAYAVIATVSGKNVEAGLEKIDKITYSLTDKSSDLSEAELEARRGDALKELSEFTAKGGIVGARASMLCAEIYFQKKDYMNARTQWLASASKAKKSYIAPLAYFNAAVCSEELGDSDSAIKYYDEASKFEDFLELSHALFSLGRLQEEKQDFTSAEASYKKIVDKNPSESWAKLAKNRIIALQAQGKLQ